MSAARVTTARESDLTIPAETVERVVQDGERIRLKLRKGPGLALVPVEDLERLENLEDWLEALDRALAMIEVPEIEAEGEETAAADVEEDQLAS